MTWNRVRPTKPGRYLVRFVKGYEFHVQVERVDGRLVGRVLNSSEIVSFLAPKSGPCFWDRAEWCALPKRERRRAVAEACA